MPENVIAHNGAGAPLEPGFRKVCIRLGLMMIVIFVSRGIASVLLGLIAPSLEGLGVTGAYAVKSLVSFAFLYIVPISAALLLFRNTDKGLCRRIYKKPVYFSNAMILFPAMYGITIMVNLISLWISNLIQDTSLSKSFNTVNDLQPDNMACAVILFVQLAVIAPVFEELWFRGIVMENLRPYGNGFAIFVSALLFGMTHANFQQFFYATLLGIALGYLAISTKSIVTTMVLHACFNSISGIMLLFLATDSVGDYILSAQSGAAVELDGVVIAFLWYMALIMLLMVVGVIMAIFKLKKINKYKVAKVQTELSAGRRWGIFFSRATVIIMLLLAADTFTFQFVPGLVYKLITGAL